MRVVPSLPASLADTTPADPAARDASTVDDRRLAAAAAFTVADAVSRWWVNYDGTSVGLRGGRWSYFGDEVVFFDLARTRFVAGVEVTAGCSGAIAPRQGAGRRAGARAREV